MTAAIETTNLPEILAEITDQVNDVANTEGRSLTELPNGTTAKLAPAADDAAVLATLSLLTGEPTFNLLTTASFLATMAEEDPEKLREGLVGLAAGIVVWIAAIDERASA